MRSGNGPIWELGVSAVKMMDGRLHIRVFTLTDDDNRITLKRWDAPAGAPTPGQCEDLVAFLTNELMATVVTTTGVQGSLGV